jgi:hypothetical protein
MAKVVRGRATRAIAIVSALAVGALVVARVHPQSSAALTRPRSLAPGAGLVDPAAIPSADAIAIPPAVDSPIVAPDHFDGPAATAPPPAALSRFGNVTPSGGTWAVLIGINDYPGTSHDLRAAVADSADMNLALSQLGVPADHRLVLQDGQATADVVRLGADWLVAHAGPDAVAVFFYAGHVRKLSSTTEAIVGADGNLVTDADLASHLARLQAGRAWIVMASCFGGGFTETLAPGRILTAAAGANDLAYENASFDRSYLVEYMVRQAMIEGRAPTTVEAAFEYARATLAREHPGREPMEIDDGPAPLDLRPPGARPAPPPRPAPASSNSSGQTPTSPPPASQPARSSGGSGGTSSPPPSTTTTTQASTCANLTLGMVRCS